MLTDRCPAGQRPNAGHTDCEMCPLGTYQPDADSTACIGCTAGTWTRLVGSIEASACESKYMYQDVVYTSKPLPQFLQRGTTFCDFLLAFLGDETLPKGDNS